MRERAGLLKPKEPRDLTDGEIGVIHVATAEISTHFIQDATEREPLRSQPSGQCTRRNSEHRSDVSDARLAVWQKRQNRVLDCYP